MTGHDWLGVSRRRLTGGSDKTSNPRMVCLPRILLATAKDVNHHTRRPLGLLSELYALMTYALAPENSGHVIQCGSELARELHADCGEKDNDHYMKRFD
jgi:hypothetical protein